MRPIERKSNEKLRKVIIEKTIDPTIKPDHGVHIKEIEKGTGSRYLISIPLKFLEGKY